MITQNQGEQTPHRFQTLEELKRNEHLISEPETDDAGNTVRFVNGVAVTQIEEKTDEDRELNHIINLWRMRAL